MVFDSILNQDVMRSDGGICVWGDNVQERECQKECTHSFTVSDPQAVSDKGKVAPLRCFHGFSHSIETKERR